MMTSSICKVFTTCLSNKCLETISEKEFQILDNELTGRGEIVKINGTLFIFNKTEKVLNFLAIDSCIYKET